MKRIFKRIFYFIRSFWHTVVSMFVKVIKIGESFHKEVKEVDKNVIEDIKSLDACITCAKQDSCDDEPTHIGLCAHYVPDMELIRYLEGDEDDQSSDLEEVRGDDEVDSNVSRIH